jgi:hypothetical protein
MHARAAQGPPSDRSWCVLRTYGGRTTEIEEPPGPRPPCARRRPLPAASRRSAAAHQQAPPPCHLQLDRARAVIWQENFKKSALARRRPSTHHLAAGGGFLRLAARAAQAQPYVNGGTLARA